MTATPFMPVFRTFPGFSALVYPENIFEARSVLQSKSNNKLDAATIIDMCQRMQPHAGPVHNLKVIGSSTSNILAVNLPTGMYSLIVESGLIQIHHDDDTEIMLTMLGNARVERVLRNR